MGDAVRVGADIGGTFTDLAFLTADGSVFREKAFTTPGDWHRASWMALDLPRSATSLARCRNCCPRVVEFTHGTTIVTNVLAQMNGLRVGLVTTGGFGDTLRIARSARQNTLDLQVQESPPQIVAPTDILELDERSTVRETSWFRLTPTRPKQESIGWLRTRSRPWPCPYFGPFENPEHERTIRAIVERDHPQLRCFCPATSIRSSASMSAR